MVEMYVWLLLTVAVAVGVLMLAGFLSRGDQDPDDDDAPASAWSAMWHDFQSATSSLRARLARLSGRGDAGTSSDAARPHPSTGRTAGHARAGQATRPAGAASSAALPASVAPAAASRAPVGTSLFASEPSESNTSLAEFFEATATDEPAYLDAAQLSDALNSLRR